MKILFIDDDRCVPYEFIQKCEELNELPSVRYFADPYEALRFIENHPAGSLTELNADEHSDNGLCLSPDMSSSNDSSKNASVMPKNDIEIRCFGNFSVYHNGRLVRIGRKKSLEILAYLVHKCGTAVSRAEIACIVFERDDYSRNVQGEVNDYIKALKSALKKEGISEILAKNARGLLAVDTSSFRCDYYEYKLGIPEALNAYDGEYMINYSWAEERNAVLYDRYI